MLAACSDLRGAVQPQHAHDVAASSQPSQGQARHAGERREGAAAAEGGSWLVGRLFGCRGVCWVPVDTLRGVGMRGAVQFLSCFCGVCGVCGVCCLRVAVLQTTEMQGLKMQHLMQALY